MWIYILKWQSFAKHELYIFFFIFEMQKALEDANDAKLRGNELFGSAQYEDALLKYDLALQLVSEVPSSDELRSVCHGNRGACFLKMVCAVQESNFNEYFKNFF